MNRPLVPGAQFAGLEQGDAVNDACLVVHITEGVLRRISFSTKEGYVLMNFILRRALTTLDATGFLSMDEMKLDRRRRECGGLCYHKTMVERLIYCCVFRPRAPEASGDIWA